MASVFVLATANSHKIKEIRAILGQVSDHIKTLKDFPPLGDILETGNSYEENAVIKAKKVAVAFGFPAIADDSGLEIEALGGKPGIYSSRFLGEQTDYATKNEKILELMKDIQLDKRKACFICAAALVFPDGESKVFRGKVEGLVAFEARGENGFGYDPIFFLPQFGKTMAELPEKEKNRLSHRSLAFQQLAEEITLFLKRSRCSR